MKRSLAYRMAKKLIDKGYLKRYNDPSDYKIIRTRAGRYMLAEGSFSWELVCKTYPLYRFGCYERASEIVKKDIIITNASFTGELIIDEDV